MKPLSQSAEAIQEKPAAPKSYATRQEVEQAIASLSNPDLVKLMLIARSFCKRRRLGTGAMEPKELLSEAILATCNMQKRWNKAMPIVKHLDRAMENISGHLARKRAKIIPFPDGLTQPEEGEGIISENPDAQVSETDKEAAVKAVLDDDPIAVTVFKLRLDGFSASEILSKLRISQLEYDTIAKRTWRKIAKYMAQSK